VARAPQAIYTALC